jgi:hypothetical protein
MMLCSRTLSQISTIVISDFLHSFPWFSILSSEVPYVHKYAGMLSRFILACYDTFYLIFNALPKNVVTNVVECAFLNMFPQNI